MTAVVLACAACRVPDALERADDLAAARRWTDAVRAYQAVLRAYPHSARAAWGIADIYCNKTHHATGCLRWSQRLIDTYPNDPRYREAHAQGLRDRASRPR